ncbi:MAG TPA: transcriptional repressor [Candidatus Cloacimonetes bacterium]|nr:transcriptional repressor [Candidatus Cloacimonadota bacterium]HEX38201.1 transcriptional repressor [Candidatus Cloacimonadota bacterium]
MKKINQFKNFLKNKNSLWSSEREQITRYILSCPDHFSADDLFLGLKQDGYIISRATVYRTLDLLVKSGLVTNTQLQSGAYIYEHTEGGIHHYHLICNKCGKIIEFHSDKIEEIQKQVCKENGFEMTGHTLRICGICKECQKKEK